MGRSYLIDHCVRSIKTRLEKHNFRVSVAENIRAILGCLTDKWDEIPSYAETVSFGKKEEPKEELSATQVIENIRNKLSGDKING